MEIRIQTMDDAGKAAIVRKIDQTAADAHAVTKFEEALHVLAVHARVMIGAQPAALSYIPRDNFHAAIHTHIILQEVREIQHLRHDAHGRKNLGRDCRKNDSHEDDARGTPVASALE